MYKDRVCKNCKAKKTCKTYQEAKKDPDKVLFGCSTPVRSDRAIKKAEYDKNNTKGIYLKLNKKTDSDIIEALAKCSNKQGLIKKLLRLNGYGDREKATGFEEG